MDTIKVDTSYKDTLVLGNISNAILDVKHSSDLHTCLTSYHGGFFGSRPAGGTGNLYAALLTAVVTGCWWSSASCAVGCERLWTFLGGDPGTSCQWLKNGVPYPAGLHGRLENLFHLDD